MLIIMLFGDSDSKNERLIPLYVPTTLMCLFCVIDTYLSSVYDLNNLIMRLLIDAALLDFISLTYGYYVLITSNNYPTNNSITITILYSDL